MDIPRQRGLVADVFDMRFFVQNRLIKMSNTPTLWNIELEQLCELLGGLSRHGIAPGAEGDEQISILIKSHVAMHLVEDLGAIRLRSDVERKRLFGQQKDSTPGQLGTGIYSADSSAITYQRLHRLAASVLHSGLPVVIDATYLKQDQREAARLTAEAAAVPLLILDCHAPQEVIARWLAQRTAEGSDPSDATMEVIEAQQAGREALSAEELLYSGKIDTSDPASIGGLTARIEQHLKGH